MNLEAIVTKYPYRKNLAEEDIVKGQISYFLKKEDAQDHNAVVLKMLVHFSKKGLLTIKFMTNFQKVKYD